MNAYILQYAFRGQRLFCKVHKRKRSTILHGSYHGLIPNRSTRGPLRYLSFGTSVSNHDQGQLQIYKYIKNRWLATKRKTIGEGSKHRHLNEIKTALEDNAEKEGVDSKDENLVKSFIHTTIEVHNHVTCYS